MNIIVGKEAKEEMFIACIPVVNKFLKCNKDSKLIKNVSKDSISFLKEALYEKKELSPEKSAVIIFSLSKKFKEIEDKVRNNEPTNIPKISNPEYWEEGNINLDVGVFFMVTFLVEKYKDIEFYINNINFGKYLKN